MQQPEDKAGVNWNRKRRSVAKILARRRIERERRQQILPPDFEHGDVAVGDMYQVLGARWTERALFCIDDSEVTTVAYFDDHFLVIEQWDSQCEMDWHQWWRAQKESRDRVITLEMGESRRLLEEATISMDVDRRRLHRLERGVLGLVRDGLVGEDTTEMRLCRGRIDILSLVTLTSGLLDME